jgi:hypothetical protein
MTPTEQAVLEAARAYASARAAFFAHAVTDAASRDEDERLNRDVTTCEMALVRAAEKMGGGG